MKQEPKKPVRSHKESKKGQHAKEKTYRGTDRNITGRKRGEETPKQSEEWFRNLFEKASDGILYLSLNGDLLVVNESFAKMHGYGVAEMQRMNIKNLDTPETSRQFPERMQRILAGEKLTLEVEHRHKDGHTIPLEVTTSLITIGDERFVLAFHRDITERKRAERALRESEERFRSIVETTVEWIWEMDLNGRHTFSNPGVTTILGYRPEEVVGQTAVSMLHAEDRAVVETTLSRLIAKKHGWRGWVLRWRHKDGSYRFLESNAEPILDSAGRVRGYRGTDRDITERKQAEEILRESEANLRKAQAYAHMGSWTWNIKTNQLDWSDEMYRIFGIEKETFSGSLAAVIARSIHPDDRRKVEQSNLSVIKDKKPLPLEYRVVWPDQSVHLVWAEAGELLLDEAGNPTLLSGNVQDITERKLAEETLRDSEARMRAIVDHAPFGAHSYELQADGRLLLVGANVAANRMLGFDHSSLMGKQIEEAFPGLVGTPIPEMYKRVAKTGQGYDTDQVEYDRGVIRGVFEIHAFQTSANRMTVFFRDITERKKVEAALRESEEIFHQFMEHSPIYVFFKDENIRAMHLSRNYEAMLGRPMSELLGKNMDDLFPSDFAKSIVAHDMRVLKDGKLIEVEEELNGRYYSTIKFPIEVEGKPRHLAGFTIDITERKQAEEVLRNSEERFRSVWESSLDGMRITDKEGTIVAVNDAYCKLVGVNREDLIGKSFNSVYRSSGEETRTAIQQYKERFSTRTVVPQQETMLELESGSMPYIDMSNAFIESTSHEPLLLSICRDITERKQSIKALHASEARLRTIIDAEPECVKILSLTGDVLEMNRAGLAMLEATSVEELQQRNLADYVVPSHRDNLMKYFRDTLQGPSGKTLEFEVVGLKGTHRWLETNAVPLLDDHQHVTAILAISRDISERKQAEEVLKRYQLLARNARDIIMYVRARDGQILEANDAAVQTYGYDREELKTKRIHDLRRPEDLDLLAQQMEQAFATGVFFETMHRRKDGGSIPVEVSASGMTIGDERVLLSIVRDVSERKQAEEALRESESKYRALVESSPDAIAIYVEGKIVFANAMSIQLMRANHINQLIGKPVIEFVHPDDRSFVAKRMMEAMKSGTPLPSAEERFIRLDGTVVDVEVKSMSVVVDGKPGAQIVVRDITERKRAEKALASERSLLRTIIDTIPDPVYVKDIQGRKIVANLAEAHFCGRQTVEEVLGKTDMELYPADVAAGSVDEERVILETGNSMIDVEGKHVLADGTERWLTGSKIVLKDANGIPTGILGVSHDITERKRLEKDRLNIEQQIQQTEKLESIGLLAGGIAHDFNNLLGGIFGYVELAKKSADAGDLTKTSERLLKAMNVFVRAKDLTKQLLTFSKGGAPAKVPGEIANTLSETTQFALSGSNVKGEYSIAGDLWPCSYDPNQIAQVIDNIVINAKHAMPSGGILEVSATNVLIDAGSGIALSDGSYIKITFKDHGIGIPEQYLQKIFDPFFTTKQSGSGLGLATCWSIVKRHDGTIMVESQPGIGSSFHVYLPAAHDPASTDSTMSAAKFVGRGRALVMDDEEHIREILEDMLTDLGYTVQTAMDGTEAIELFNRAINEGNPFDIVLVDLTIPGGIGGKETLTRLLDLNPDVCVIASSGYSEDPVISTPLEFGFAASIRKPYRKAELVEALTKALVGRKA